MRTIAEHVKTTAQNIDDDRGQSTSRTCKHFYESLVTTYGKNSSLVSGLEWGGDLSGVLTNYQLQGTNIAYGVHLYPGPNSSEPINWDNRFGNLAKRFPVMASEFGQLDCGQNFLSTAMPYLATHTQGMIAWTWDQGDCGRPALLSDWQGAPTSYGAVIQHFFQGINP